MFESEPFKLFNIIVFEIVNKKDKELLRTLSYKIIHIGREFEDIWVVNLVNKFLQIIKRRNFREMPDFESFCDENIIFKVSFLEMAVFKNFEFFELNDPKLVRDVIEIQIQMILTIEIKYMV